MEKTKTIKLSVRLKYPGKAFTLGRHKITKTPQEFELNHAEVLELGTPGPQHWLVIPEEKPKKRAAKK